MRTPKIIYTDDTGEEFVVLHKCPCPRVTGATAKERVLSAIEYTRNADFGLTTKQLAFIADVSPATVRKYIKPLEESGVVGRCTYWYGQFEYTWLYYYA